MPLEIRETARLKLFTLPEAEREAIVHAAAQPVPRKKDIRVGDVFVRGYKAYWLVLKKTEEDYALVTVYRKEDATQVEKGWQLRGIRV